MITIKNQDNYEHVVVSKYFPDKTFCINLPVFKGELKIYWKYEQLEEELLLWQIVNHLRDIDPNQSIKLIISYMPDARMDRVHDKICELFTLKNNTKLINAMNFNQVIILDPHSDVTPALINHCFVLDPYNFISDTIDRIKYIAYGDKILPDNDHFIIYYPDLGAVKRYHQKSILTQYHHLYGNKVRDWSTGKITKLDVIKEDGSLLLPGELDDKTVLMIDDIICYGGTLAYSADKLKECGAKEVYAYATHTENSALNRENSKLVPRLENGIINKVFTTNSIFTAGSQYFTVYNWRQSI